MKRGSRNGKEMGELVMNKVITAMNHLEGKEKEELNKLLRNAPVWLLNACTVLNLKKGEIFVREKEPVQTVYILIKGTVKACDFRMLGVAYEFCRYEAVDILGGMELFVECEQYQTTLITETPCQFITVAKDKFAKWMREDANAQWFHSNKMINYLLAECRRERAYLFLQGTDRVYLFFEFLYERCGCPEICASKITRQQISDETGLSVKTINRALSKMAEEELITIKGRQILLSRGQYEELKERTAEKIDM